MMPLHIKTTKLINSSLYISILHCMKSIRIQSYSGPYFPAFGLNTEGILLVNNVTVMNTVSVVTGGFFEKISFRFLFRERTDHKFLSSVMTAFAAMLITQRHIQTPVKHIRWSFLKKSTALL